MIVEGFLILVGQVEGLRMKQAIRRVFVGWSIASLVILMSFSRNGWSASSGGELAMLMYIASLPSSILTGLLLNMVNPEFPVAPAFIQVFLIWVSFCFFGLGAVATDCCDGCGLQVKK